MKPLKPSKAPAGSAAVGKPPVKAVQIALLVIALSFAIGAIITNRDSLPRSIESKIARFRTGAEDSVVLDTTQLTAPQRQAILALPLTQHINVGDVATQEACATGPVVIKRAVVNMLDKVVATILAAHPAAKLAVSNGWRPKKTDMLAGGSGAGPHVRGDCLDVAFDIPGSSSRASAVAVADAAFKLGIKGIALLNDSSRYLVHLDPVRSDPWYVEQVWQPIGMPSGRNWATYYQGVNPAAWSESPTAPAANDDLSGDWMATSIISGTNVVNGSMKSRPLRITLFRKSNGHFGMRIPDDRLPEATAAWDAVSIRPGTFSIRYKWPQKPPDKGVEEFSGTIELKDGVAIRNTVQTNAAYPGEVTRVNARWVRVSPARRGIDPELSWHDNVIFSHGMPRPDSDGTSTGGQFIDRELFESRCYRESAPGFESHSG